MNIPCNHTSQIFFAKDFLACFKLALTCFILFMLYNVGTYDSIKPDIHRIVVQVLQIGTIVIGVLRSNAVVRQELAKQGLAKWKYLGMFLPLFNAFYLFKLSNKNYKMNGGKRKVMMSLSTSFIGVIMYSIATMVFSLFFIVVLTGTFANIMKLF